MSPIRLTILLLALAAVRPAAAVTGDGTYDISYLWTPYLQGALDYGEMVAEQLGPDVERHLQIVLGGSGNYGLIYDRGGTDAREARKVANRHHRILRDAFGGRDLLADVLDDDGFERLHHVQYATGDLETCRQRHAELGELLGDAVARALVVQQTQAGHAVLYQLYGTAAQARDVAAEHTAKHDGVEAVVVDASGGAPVWDSSSASPSAPATPPDPAAVDESLVLRFDQMDQALRDKVNDHIQALRGRGEIPSDESTAWLVYDLAADRTLVAINSEQPMQCASMVKPFVALAFFHEVERGRFIYGDRSRTNLEAMLQRSSNEATNWFIDTIGGVDRTRRILQDSYGELLPHLQLVEKIPPGGGTYRNRASAEDYTRFLRALWRDELPHAAEIRRAMNLPNQDRIYRGVPPIPAGTAVYDKTGTTARLVGDMGILVARDGDGKSAPYVVVGIIEKKRRHPSLRTFARSRGDVIREVSGLVYEELSAERNLR